MDKIWLELQIIDIVCRYFGPWHGYPKKILLLTHELCLLSMNY